MPPRTKILQARSVKRVPLKGKISYLKKDSWLTLLVLAALLLALLQLLELSTLRILPGPLFGGDVYYHQGHIRSIYEGGSPFMSSHFLGEYEHYPWLSHLFAAVFSRLVGNTYLGHIYFPIIMLFMSVGLIYFATLRWLDSKATAAGITLLYVCVNLPLMYTPSSFAVFTSIPFVLYFLAKLDTTRDYIYGGVVLGLGSLTHPTPFLAGLLYVLLRLLFTLFSQYKRNSYRLGLQVWKTFRHTLIGTTITCVISIAIAMIYYGPLIIGYQLSTLNNWQEYTQVISLQTLFQAAWSLFQRMFFDYTTVAAGIISLSALIAVLSSAVVKKEEDLTKMQSFSLLVLVVGILGVLHPIFTQPLLGTSFGYYSFPRVLQTARITLAYAGIYLAYCLVSRKFLVTSAFSVLLIYTAIAGVEQAASGDWFSGAKKENQFVEAYHTIGNQMLSTINRERSTLTLHPEAGFALNAVTGLPVVYMRRTHASPFVDVDQRYLDATLMLYGNDSAHRSYLRGQYQTGYIFVDPYGTRTIS
ncbi:MAG: glycosyltransferase family 39 protein, partial [Nitrosarchaeum sp.]|nr:glycosyltransferase family 39 protein [Nitrosarchaeum sp.]